jgi:hypothetical protein
MLRSIAAFFVTILAAALLAIPSIPVRAQDQFQFEHELLAKRRVFNTVGAGFRAIHRGPDGNFYVLTAPATALQIYTVAGKQIGQFPGDNATASKGASLVYGESFDIDGEGRIVVCDRGANAVKIYTPNGALSASIAVRNPSSVVFLPGGDVAVASSKTPHLVSVYNLSGQFTGEFGDREDIADRADVNDQVNFGELAVDETGNVYFAFDFLPEPTLRKFDRGGEISSEIVLNTLEFQPAAQAARRTIADSLGIPARRATAEPLEGTPSLHRIITAFGVDPQTQDVWLAIGTQLMHFDKDGQRLATFRTYTPDGARLEASTILVEPDRLLIGADPQGIYEFPKPDKLP